MGGASFRTGIIYPCPKWLFLPLFRTGIIYSWLKTGKKEAFQPVSAVIPIENGHIRIKALFDGAINGFISRLWTLKANYRRIAG